MVILLPSQIASSIKFSSGPDYLLEMLCKICLVQSILTLWQDRYLPQSTSMLYASFHATYLSTKTSGYLYRLHSRTPTNPCCTPTLFLKHTVNTLLALRCDFHVRESRLRYPLTNPDTLQNPEYLRSTTFIFDGNVLTILHRRT